MYPSQKIAFLLIAAVAAAGASVGANAAPPTPPGVESSTMKYIVTLDRFDTHGEDRRRALLRQNARQNLLSELASRSSHKRAKSSRSSSGDEDSVFEAVITNEFTTILNGFAGRFSKDALKFLESHEDVVSVELDPRLKAISDERATEQSNPQWGLDRIDQKELPLDNTYHYDSPACADTKEGCGVRLYVIDTGAYLRHNDFKARISRGYNFDEDKAGGHDCDGHGTHCASTAAGTRWGVAKNVDIVPLRVLDCRGFGHVSSMISAVEWALLDAKKAGVRGVATISLGWPTWPASGETAINNSVDEGLIVVAAAGNEAGDACLSFPAAAQKAITVGSTMSNDGMSSFSNFGPCVDIFAPGSDITAASHRSRNGKTSMSGTSMATPHVAGVAARTLTMYPKATSKEIITAMYCDAVDGVVSNVPVDTNTPNRLLQVPTSDGSGDLSQCALTCASGCDAHGECVLGVCRCDVGFRGNDCSEDLCPNNCGDHGKCESDGCTCEWGWKGASCSESIEPIGRIEYDDKKISGSTVGGAHFPDSKGAVVYYTLDIGETEEYSISTCFPQTTFDTMLFVLNEKGKTLASNDDDRNCKHNREGRGGESLSSVITTRLSPGSYNIVIGGFETEGDFVVDVKCPNCLGLENCRKFEGKEKKACKKRNKRKIKEHEQEQENEKEKEAGGNGNDKSSRGQLLRGGG